MVIKDRIALGAFAGMAATLPQLALNALSVNLGIARYYDFQISAGIYLYASLTRRPLGLLFGGLIWEMMAAGLGVITAFLLAVTGRSYWWLKGLLVSNTVMFIFIYGFYYSLGGPRIVPWDLATNWSLFVENVLFGLLMGYLTARWMG